MHFFVVFSSNGDAFRDFILLFRLRNDVHPHVCTAAIATVATHAEKSPISERLTGTRAVSELGDDWTTSIWYFRSRSRHPPMRGDGIPVPHNRATNRAKISSVPVHGAKNAGYTGTGKDKADCR